jgi:multidrug efflux system membrane fusion protein
VATFWVGVARDNSAPAASAAAQASAPAVPVTEGQAETRDVPIWLSGIGSVQPLNAVTVKVRVDGELDRVAFTEGQDVRKGDVLAQIDPRSFRAQLKQAQANKAKDEAQLANARLDLERSMRLEAKGVATKQTLDTQRAQVAALERAALVGFDLDQKDRLVWSTGGDLRRNPLHRVSFREADL